MVAKLQHPLPPQQGGHDVHLRDPVFGWAPLLFAASGGAARLCKVLLDAKAKGDVVCNEGNTALILAARQGHNAVVELLISRRAVSLDVQSRNGWTALMSAGMNGHEEIGTTLIAAQADYQLCDAEGRTACMWAARHIHTNIVEAILAYGVNLNIQDHEGRTVMDHAKEHLELRAFIAATEELNCKILEAAQRNDLEAVAEAIEAGANVNLRDETGWTPIMWAAVHGSLDLVGLLTRHGAIPELVDADGRKLEELAPQHFAVGEALDMVLGSNTRMIAAARRGEWDHVEEELRVGAFIHQRDAERRTAVLWAARWGSAEVVQLLHSRNADLNDRDQWGWTTLHSAIAAESEETLSMLHYLGADFSLKTFDGDSALHLAGRVDNASMVQVVLASEAVDMEELDLDGRTALQLGAACGASEGVGTLLHYGADHTCHDESNGGCGLLSLAIINGHIETCDVMLHPLEKPPSIPGVEEPTGEEKKTTKSRKTARSGHKAGSQNDGSPHAVLDTMSSTGVQKTIAGSKVQTPLGSKNPFDRRPSKPPTPRSGMLAQGKCPPTPRSSRSPGATGGSFGSRTSVGSPGRTGSKMSGQGKPIGSGARLVARRTSTRNLRPPSRTPSQESLAGSPTGKSVEKGPSSKSPTLTRKSQQRGSTVAERRAKVEKRESVCVGDKPTALLELAAAARAAVLKKVTPTPANKLLRERDTQGSSPLHLAVLHNQETIFFLLLESRADVHAPDSQGCTPLHVAVRLGKRDVCQELLTQSANATVQNKAGEPPRDLTSDPVLIEMLDKAAVRRHLRSQPESVTLVFDDSNPLLGEERSPYRIRVESLPVVVTEEMLREHIRSFFRRLDAYNISRIEVPEDPITFKPHGFAYVEFGDAAALELAMQGDGGQICGSSVCLFKDNILLKAMSL